MYPVTTNLDPRDEAALRALAKAADRSLAGEVRHAIRKHLTSESPAGQPSSRDNPGAETADHVVRSE